MNLKSYLFLIALFLISLTVNAQLKVWTDGHVTVNNLSGSGQTTFGNVTSTGIITAYNKGVFGTTVPYSSYTLRVAGDPGLVVTYGGSYLRMTSRTDGAIIGSSYDKIDFWSSSSLGHNKVHAQHYYVESDSSRKMNIVPLNNGLSVVMQLNPVSFNFKPDSINFTPYPGYGFIAQEVEQIIPQIVDTSMGIKMMSYDQVIPFLVDAIQTQQAQIDSLTAEIDSLNERMIIQEQCDCKIKNKSSEFNNGGSQTGSTITPDNSYIELGQNNPNPFKESTTINYILPESTKSAQIIVYDLQGKELESYQITRFGEGNIIVDGSTFKPGMYVYALVVDGNYIDSKKMILTK